MENEVSRRPYIRPVDRAKWWLRQPRYIRYMMREVSAVLIGAYVLLLIVGLLRLSQGQAEYEAFLDGAWGNLGVAFSVVAMLFALYHTYSWFQLTPKAMPLSLAGKRVSGLAIVGAHWVGFAVVSAALLVLMRL